MTETDGPGSAGGGAPKQRRPRPTIARLIGFPADLRLGRDHRILGVLTMVDSAGTGLFLTVSVVFFTRELGLEAGQVALGLSIAGFVGLLTPIPIGRIADRADPRLLLAALLAVQSLLYAAYLVSSSFVAFCVLVSLIAGADRGCRAVFGAMIASIGGEGGRVPLAAFNRAIFNVGYAVGALLAGLAITAGTASAYTAVIAVNAVSFLVAGGLALSLRRPDTRTGSRARPVLRDVPFLALTVVNSFLALHATLLTVGIPLWVLAKTSAPPVTIAAIAVVNTLLVIALQVRFSRSAKTVTGAATVVRRSSILLAVAAALFGLAAAPSSALSAAILLCGAVALTAGEMWQQAGSWGLSFGLAPEEARAEYLAAFGLGYNAQEMYGPLLMAALVIGLGTVGWLILAAGFLICGAAIGPMSAWVTRRTAHVAAA